MPHPTKRQKVDCHQRDDTVVTGNDFVVASFDDLSVDVLPNILGFLTLKDIMSKRRINKKTREAVKMTIVPDSHFWINSVDEYNAMVVMTRALPKLQQISLRGLGRSLDGRRHKYNDGEDPDVEYAARFTDYTTHDIGIISNFRKLRILEISVALMNGRYPVFFNFPLLQKLSMRFCDRLKWDLEMLAGLPVLKELECIHNDCLTGDIGSLRVLKDTLEKVNIRLCDNVEGNLMDLADFPHLKELDLYKTAVTGDIREIDNNDFSSLEQLTLPKSVYGGRGHELQRISEGNDLMRTLYLFKKQRPTLEMQDWYGKLSEDSPDWYESVDDDEYDVDTPPFDIYFAKAGSRVGYRWKTEYCEPCEVNWLDPEPDRESSDYSNYIEELEQINSQAHMYRGFHQPPTEEEYIRLWEEYNG